MAAPRHPHPWRGCCGPSSFGWRNKREAALTQHAVAPHGVAGPSGALARGGTVHAKIPLRAGVVAAEREKKGGEMPPGTGGSRPCPAPPVTWVPSSRPGRGRHPTRGRSSPKRTRGRGAGIRPRRCPRGRSCCSCRDKARRCQGAGTPARTHGRILHPGGSGGYLGPIQPGSQCRHDPVSASQASPCRQRGHGWRQPSPWKPGAQRSLHRVPFQPGWHARQKPSTGEQGWLRLQLPQLHGHRGGEASASPPQKNTGFCPTAASIWATGRCRRAGAEQDKCCLGARY